MPLYMVTVSRNLIVEAESPARAVSAANNADLETWTDKDLSVWPVSEDGSVARKYRAAQLAAEAPATQR